MSDTLYAVRELGANLVPSYAIPNPAGEGFVSQRQVPEGNTVAPAKLPLKQAVALAVELAGSTGVAWGLQVAPRPCPACGREIDADDQDFCYPENRERTRWRAGCNEHDGGCGHELFAASYENVILEWNKPTHN